jgi:hypothetical protein
MQQRTRLTAYEEGATFTTCKIGRLRHVNAIFHSGARTPSEQDRGLEERTEMITDHRLSDIEHGWNYTRMLLDITREEVETRTHGIVHHEHHVEEAQDTELEERTEMIADLE